MSEPYKNLSEVMMNDALVKKAFAQGLPPSEIIVMLVNEKRRMAQCIAELGAIVPKKITYAGQTYIWHCPEHLIPEMK